MSADDNTQLWKYTIATGSDAQVDIDPSNTSGDSKSRDMNIQALWYDGTYIWGIDGDNDGIETTFDVWKLAVADDSTTEIGTGTMDDGDCYAYDIFKIGEDVFGVVVDNDNSLEIWQVDTAPLTLKDSMGLGAV